MGKRGPKAAPTNLKVVRGDRKSRINQREPKAPVAPEAPEPPDWCSSEAKKTWGTLAPGLFKRGLLTEWDVDSFAVLCEAVFQHRQACEEIAKSGVLVEGYRGSLVKNPALQIARDASQTIRAYAQEFGLTPSARSAISMPDGVDGALELSLLDS